MSDKRIFILSHEQARQGAIESIRNAQPGWKVTVEPPKRSRDQNALLHAICQGVAKQMQWHGVKRNYLEWKMLFVSGHATATKGEVDLDRGLEGEIVNFRESTARMDKKRFNSLLDYIYAWCAENGLRLHDEREVTA